MRAKTHLKIRIILLRRAQEYVELSLKAILRSIAIEYPRDHDVGEALEAARETFPEWFLIRIDDFKRIEMMQKNHLCGPKMSIIIATDLLMNFIIYLYSNYMFVIR